MKHAVLVLPMTILLSAFHGLQRRVNPDVEPDRRAEAAGSASQIEGTLVVPGLDSEVEVLRDEWGIPHLYARSARDLFMAQGFVAAQDRLWQMEMWRRAGEGKMAEILGPSAIPRDRFARLMRFRGNMEEEWKSYSPDAREIVLAFVAGVNANIAVRRDNPPFEFKLMGIAPELWSPEVCLTRMAGYVMTRNASNEIARAQLVRKIGVAATQRVWPLDPPIPIEIPRGLDLDALEAPILSGGAAAGASPNFGRDEGSNNWTVSGALTATRKPILANDPHRALSMPSLRYMAHLVGPGWNVIGAGEPTLPGIAVGHNERIAFGFTIVGIDQQDLYLEELNPENPLQYRHRGKWLTMETVKEEIRVKGQGAQSLELRFTIHGPVVYEDHARHRAYALRWVGTEPGTAGYLASLSLDRATNWNDFLAATERWKVPSENLAYADVDGNIGWQAAALTPVRKAWTGLLPVPGNGDYEWQGFLPSSELPRYYNPGQGFIATANHNILPQGYHRSLGYEWAASWRFRRIEEVLRSRKGFTIDDFRSLQHDETSLPARALIPLLRPIDPTSDATREARRRLLVWNQVLERKSAEAALYEIWVQKLVPLVWSRRLPASQLKLLGNRASLDLAIRWLQKPTPELFGSDPALGRNKCLLEALESAVTELQARFGPDMNSWSWGALHQAVFTHPLATDAALRSLMDRGPVPRGGDGNTVNNTSLGSNFRQTSGASYRQILDLSDWDRSVAINVPGQSGEPGSPHYDDLLSLWGEGKYHPLAYSRQFVEKVTKHRLVLKPAS